MLRQEQDLSPVRRELMSRAEADRKIAPARFPILHHTGHRDSATFWLLS